MNIAPLGREATVEDLYQAEGKAELVNGELVLMSPSGDEPGAAALQIATSLNLYAREHSTGRAYGDNVGFVVAGHRRSFSPDAAWYTGPRSRGKYLPEAPAFAVEVRSEGDYGPAAERKMAAKRAHYFSSGTRVVWDVDVLREEVVRVYRADEPEHPVVYRRGETAEAEPAVPGWRFPVDDLWL